MNFEAAVLEAPMVGVPQTGPTPHGRAAVSDEDKLAELRRVIDSPDFPATPRNRAFLEYIVRRELAGDAHAITAHDIATSVFGRSDTFNSLLDPIVRIEAGKLRRDLETYYLKSGQRNPLRITVPKGAYRPHFAAPEDSGSAAAPEHNGGALDADPRAELRRVIDSPDFPASPRNRRFLAYVVERELEGQGAHLTAYQLGTEVFGRPPGFNPLTDPIVRIEAGKLRRDLETYYLKSGSRNPLRIGVPKGAYRPVFLPSV